MIPMQSFDGGVYAGRRVLVTGGLGFIGSNLVAALVEHGASVRVIDSLDPQCGGSYNNLAGLRDDVEVLQCDIREQERVQPFLKGVETIFNLAGDISHVGSMRDPRRDLELNLVAQLGFLQCCAATAPGIRIIYTSTRQVYGKAKSLPVNETHAIMPVDFNGIHKCAATHYHLLLQRLGLLDSVVLRLTNVYGPRMGLRAGSQGFLAAFFRRALEREPIHVFGDGKQLRDPLFVDDAVECLLRAGAVGSPEHRLMNVGRPAGVSILHLARVLSRVASLPPPKIEPFPGDRDAIDIGSYASDATLAEQTLGWRASTKLLDGLQKTWDYYAPLQSAFSFAIAASQISSSMAIG